MTTRKKKFEPVPQERALVPVPPEEILPEPEPEIPTPAAFETILLKPGQNISDLPLSDNPYFVATQDKGMFMYRPMVIGSGMVKAEKFSPLLGKVEDFQGWYKWGEHDIPAEIVSQIVHFFRRIYDKWHTEAEVLLLLNPTSGEWKVWVPTQKVSGASVDSRYEQSDIPRGFIVVGTMHSHCMMGAFHSGTDIGDAEEFDGIHVTVGKVMNDPPEFDVMIMMNKAKFTATTDLVGDFTQLDIAEAPEFWDEFVAPSGKDIKPRGVELFEKYPSTKTVVTHSYTPYKYTPHQTYRYGTWGDDDEFTDAYFRERYGYAPYQPAPGQQIPYQKPLSEYSSDRYKVEDDDDLLPGFTRTPSGVWVAKPNTSSALATIDSPYELHDEAIDKLLDSSILLEDEWDNIIEGDSWVADIRLMLMRKMVEVSSLLETFGMDVSHFTIKAKKPSEIE